MDKCDIQVWSRVTGFFRPISDWNKGKREEFNERKKFKGEIDEKNSKCGKKD